MPDFAVPGIGGKSADESGQEVLDDLKKIADGEGKIVGALDWTQNRLVDLGKWFRFVVMIPCYSIVGLVSVVVVIPVIAAWFFAG